MKHVATSVVTLLIAFSMHAQAADALTSRGEIGNDPGTNKIMNELGMGLDIAENNLRILLNKPANGTRFKSYEVSCKNQLQAAMALLNYEMRHPGYLQGKYGKAQWPQYNEVRDLFEQASEKYDFYYKGTRSKSSTSNSSGGTR